MAARWASELDSEVFYPPEVAPSEAASLAAAAREFALALAPASANAAEAALIALRSITITRREDVDEAEVNFRGLVAALAHVPSDIIRKACTNYSRVEGPRYFPKSPGEILAFINPILVKRERGAHRFAEMAKAAEVKARREAELNDPTLNTLEEMRALSPSMRLSALKKGWCTQAQLDQLDAEQGLGSAEDLIG